MTETEIYKFKKRQLTDTPNIEDGEGNWDIVEEELENIEDTKADKTTVTSNDDGLMISADKVKLDGIAYNANNYTHPLTHDISVINGLQEELDDKISATDASVDEFIVNSNLFVGTFELTTIPLGCFIAGYDNRIDNEWDGMDGLAERAIALGNNNVIQSYGVAIGNGNVSNYKCVLIGENNHSWDDSSSSIIIGEESRANINHSYSIGHYLEAGLQHGLVIGAYNDESLENYYYENNAVILQIGNGSSDTDRGDAFRFHKDGKLYADGTYYSTGADYAEFFEWNDGNVENADRVGHFVTFDNGDNIRICNSEDTYILGVISATAGVVGDSYELRWRGEYLTDDFGRILTEQKEVVNYKTIEKVNEDGVRTFEEVEIDRYIGTFDVQNPDYNSEEEYISRENRPEWDCVGMLGKLYVRQDGTCELNGYCKPNDEGIATKAESRLEGYRIIEIVNKDVIRILFK